MSREVGAIPVGRARARERRLEDLPRRADDPPVQSRDSNLVTRFHDRVLHLGIQLGILLEERIDLRGRLNVRPMVEEMRDGNALRQFDEAADMIAVVVSGNEVVDLLEACLADSGHDAIGVAGGGRASVPRIDEHRLTGRRHVESGVTALHVYHIHVQCLRRLRCGKRRKEGETRKKQNGY